MENGKPARVSAELGEEKEATAEIASAGLGAAERIPRGGRPPYVPIKALGVGVTIRPALLLPLGWPLGQGGVRKRADPLLPIPLQHSRRVGG